jgi:hypothetical protein
VTNDPIGRLQLVFYEKETCKNATADDDSTQKLVVRRVRPNGMYDRETKLALGQVFAKTLVNGVLLFYQQITQDR